MSIEDIPAAFADFAGVSEGVAQVILSTVVVLTFVLPTMLLTRGKNATTIWLIMLFFAEILLVGLGWVPFWVLIMTVAVVALSIATLGAKVVTGGT